MYRVLVPALVSLLLAGCSMAELLLADGRICRRRPADQLAPPAEPQRSASAETPSAVADSPAKRYASADDHIPRGIVREAPAGALADRDYGSTQLDPDKARELINAYRKEKGLKPLEAQRRPDRGGQGPLAKISPSGTASRTTARTAPTPGTG